MNKQESQKLETLVLKELKQLKKSDTIIAAISGGADSVFLLHFLKQTDAKIVVAHVNHQLRKEAKNDEAFVKSISSSHLFELKEVDINKLSKKNKTGIEETGRKERYKFFNNLTKKHKATYIITAHHADDNLETILLNFTRGASLKGLCGMQKVESGLYRPLLDLSKKEICAYLKFKEIAYREDESNEDNKYSRNFIRNEIIPQLKELNPNLASTTRKNTVNLREIQSNLENSAQEWIKNNEIEKCAFDAKSFRAQPPVIQKNILLKLHQKQLGHTQNIESIHLEEVISIINGNIGNKKKKLGKLVIAIKNNHLRVEN
jgi:tRNA(Ile)-lysidine synthase